MENESDDIPAIFPLDKPLTWKFAFAGVSFIMWISLCAASGALLMGRITPPDRPTSWAGVSYLGVASLLTGVGIIIGKYGWLYLMSFVVTEAEVGPWVAFGGRILPFDRRFIRKRFQR